MMLPRLTPPAPEIEYFLDCAQEAWELDACSALTLRLYGDDAEMAAIIDRPDPQNRPRSHFKYRRERCIELAQLADAMLPQLPAAKRAGLICAGLKHITRGIAELAETMSYWTIEDEIDGGCMVNFRHDRARCRNGVTFKRTQRRLHSPRFIRRVVKTTAAEHADHLLVLHDLMMRRAQTTAPIHDPELTEIYRATHRREAELRLIAEYGKSTPPSRHEIRNARKVIRRSLNVALSLLGRDTVSSFLRGEEVRLIGTEAILMLRKRGTLSCRGHGSLSIAIADRNGTTLADLCTFIENTPTLDQLCGFALWMKAGEERRIMETANILRLEDGARDHPIVAHHYETIHRQLIQEFGEETIRNIAELAAQPRRPVVRQLTHEQQRERWQNYWNHTKGEWLEAMFAFVIGYRNFPTYKAAGAL